MYHKMLKSTIYKKNVAVIKKTDIMSNNEDVEELEPSHWPSVHSTQV